MHISAYKNMDTALDYITGENIKVADIGSMQAPEGMQATYRKLVMDRGWGYVGFDIAYGPNVDHLMEEYNIPLVDNVFDAVISGNTVEHVRNIFQWTGEIVRVLKPHGKLILIAPHHTAKYHPFPIDCWRLMPGGMKSLLEANGLNVLYSDYGWHTETDDKSNTDVVGIGEKL
jgi:SAM-dependent methyltransferase